VKSVKRAMELGGEKDRGMANSGLSLRKLKSKAITEHRNIFTRNKKDMVIGRKQVI